MKVKVKYMVKPQRFRKIWGKTSEYWTINGKYVELCNRFQLLSHDSKNNGALNLKF